MQEREIVVTGEVTVSGNRKNGALRCVLAGVLALGSAMAVRAEGVCLFRMKYWKAPLFAIAFVAVVAQAVCALDWQNPLSGRTAITAHTGCMGTPMNTIESIRKGIACGADTVEIDLHFTEAGVPVLSHDKPKKDGKYELLANAFRELAKHPGIKCNVDVKSTSHLDVVKRMAEEVGVLDRIFYTGLAGDRDVAETKRQSSGVPFYMNVKINGKTDIDAVVRHAKEIGAIGLNLYFKGADATLVRKCHEAGLEVSVWTVDRKDDIVRFLEMGVDNITTRKPDQSFCNQQVKEKNNNEEHR